jgi:hypothetical protein
MPIRVITMPILAIKAPIPAITMRRSARSRCGDLRGHDGALRAVKARLGRLELFTVLTRIAVPAHTCMRAATTAML